MDSNQDTIRIDHLLAFTRTRAIDVDPDFLSYPTCVSKYSVTFGKQCLKPCSFMKDKSDSNDPFISFPLMKYAHSIVGNGVRANTSIMTKLY